VPKTVAASLRGVRSYFTGPLASFWNLLSLLLALIGVARAANGHDVWMWLCFSAVALLGISVTHHVLEHVRGERALGPKLDGFLREGMSLLDELTEPPTVPQDIFASDGPLNRVYDLHNKAFDVLRESAPEFAADPGKAMDAAHVAKLGEIREIESRADRAGGSVRMEIADFVARERAQNSLPVVLLRGLLDGLAGVKKQLRE
jgi:hypothetical protein